MSPTAGPTDDASDRDARVARRRQLAARLGRVDLALLQWEEWQDDQEWPRDRRRGVPAPRRAYESLTALRARVIAQLARERRRAA
jgi:hypothetical protein